MNSFTRNNYLIQLRKFNQNSWDILTKQEKENLLQWIIDYESHQLGLEPMCTIKIGKTNGYTTSGEFNEQKRQIIIEEDLALNGLKPPYHIPKIQNKNLTREYDTYGTLMHEFKHAFQFFVKKHPEKFCGTKYFDMIFSNSKSVETNSFYFDINYSNKEKQFVSDLLYKIQPVERDALMFQERKLRKFAEDIHCLFPDKYPNWYSGSKEFSNVVNSAKLRYNTEYPFQEIDHIIKNAARGESISNLNQKIINDICETQHGIISQHMVKLNQKIDIDINRMVDLNDIYNNEQDLYHNITDEAYDELYQDRE